MSSEKQNVSNENILITNTVKLTKDKEMLISYEGNSKHYEIPNGIKIIGEKAFAGNKQIQSIVIPETVIAIESAAFELCTALKQVTFKGTDVVIGEYCFAFCEMLSDIVLPKRTTSIGRSAFAHNAIERISIPESLKVLECSVFNSCKSLKQVVFKGTSIEIGEGCFIGCEALEDISLPKCTKAIGESAFEYCESLKQIHIPGTVQCVSHDAFSGCKNLKDVVLSEGVKEIQYGAFLNCDALEEIYLPYSMEYVGCYSFTKLKRCYFENPKTRLEEDAFGWCGDDFRLFLPKGSEINKAGKSMPKGIIGYNTDPEVGPVTYDHLSSNMIPYMADIPIEDIVKGPDTIDSWGPMQYVDKKGGIYAYGRSCLLMLDRDYFRNNKHHSNCYQIIDGTKYICDYAFHLSDNYLLGREYDSNHCPFVTIELPSSVIAIGDFSFARCNELATITLPEKLSYIGKNPFRGNEKAKSNCFQVS